MQILSRFFGFRSFSCFKPVAAALLILTVSNSLPAAPDADRAKIALKPLEVADGLEIDLFAADPLLYNPVAFTIDEKGRFFISETHRYKDSIFDIWAADQRWKDADASFKTIQDRADFLKKEYADNPEFLTKDSEIIRMIEDRSGDKKADFSEVFADGFNLPISGTAAGVLAHNGTLWFTSIPDLWRFEYDESGKQTKSEILHNGYGVHIGVSGHDLHGLIMGPDGKIYFTVGDRGAHIETAEGKLIDLPNTGAAFRCDPDGSNLEVFAIGLRNPQDLAFDKYGNLWTHDNDTAGKDKSRVIHVVEGADYGWRYSYQFMTGFGPWVQESVWAGGIDDVLPNAGYGAQGPSGIAYYPGVGLPEKYEHHFFACDFPKGVLSYSANPHGASYQIDKPERFLWNAGITDVNFGPDGDIYFSDWGRSYQMPDGGHIYRIFDPEQTDSPKLAELKKILADGMSDRPLPELENLLAHADMRIRQAAQFELIDRAVSQEEEIAELLQKTVLENENLFARLHAIWALEKLQPEEARETFITLLEDPESEIRAHAAKAIGSAKWTSLAPKLTTLLKDPNPRVRAHAAASLGKLSAAENKTEIDRAVFFDPILELLRENNDEDAYLTHAGMMALLDLDDFSYIEKAAADESAAVRRVALLAMRRLHRPEIVRFFNDSNERNRYEAVRAINDAPINKAMPDLAKLLEENDLPEKFLSRIINANFRVGKPENANRLAAFAARPETPADARIEAISALGDWENPAPRDRVVGLWRPLDSREISPARTAFAKVADSILEKAPEKVQAAIIETAAKLDAREMSDALFSLLKNPETPVLIRQSIPAALVKLEFPRLPEMMEVLLTDDDRSIRRSGIELLDKIEIPETGPLLAEMIATEKNLQLSQTAIATLGRLDQPETDDAIASLLDQMLDGNLRRELHLDLLEAAGKRSSPKVEKRLKLYAKTLDPADPTAEFRPTLTGGDAALGKKLFHERDELGCLRCHSVNGAGGNVGPDLSNIGAERNRLYLLESIVEPNKHFAPGYELVVLELKNGETVAGTVENESETEISIIRQDRSERVQKSEIKKRHPSISAMPSGLEKLMTPRELRDLIEYLAQLKE